MSRYAFLFPGQGSQYVGMGQSLVESYPVAQRVFEQADDTLGYSLSRLCFFGPENDLTNTANAQLAILVTSIAAWKVLTEHLEAHPGPAVVAGHSLGEYSALVVSEALEFEDAIRLVRARGEAMRDAGEIAPGGMLAVLGEELEIVERLCADVMQNCGCLIEIANDNCPGQIVVAGAQEALNAFTDLCVERDINAPIPLKVSVAPHTSLMKAALPEFLHILAKTPLRTPTIPLIGNVSADWLTTQEQIRDDLNQQLFSTVRWSESMRCLVERDIGAVVEVGPGKVLTGLMRRIDKNVKRANFGNEPRDLSSVISLVTQFQGQDLIAGR